MSGATFGNGAYYQTTYGRAGRMPLPYPPREVWCAWLSGVSTAYLSENRLMASISGQSFHSLTSAASNTQGMSGATRLVFLALHEDWYNADWIVHEPRLGLPIGDWLAEISAVGCAIRPIRP